MKENTRFETTTLTEKGQIAIPPAIRKELHLKPGSRFVVMGRDDTLVLKKIYRPFERFDEIVKKGRKFAREKRITEKDIEKGIMEYREKHIPSGQSL